MIALIGATSRNADLKVTIREYVTVMITPYRYVSGLSAGGPNFKAASVSDPEPSRSTIKMSPETFIAVDIVRIGQLVTIVPQPHHSLRRVR